MNSKIPSLAELGMNYIRSLNLNNAPNENMPTLGKMFTTTKITPFFKQNFALIENFLYNILVTKLNYVTRSSYEKPTSRDYASVFGKFGKFIGILWINHKEELFDLLHIPTKKHNALGYGKLPNVEEIMNYLEIKTYTSFDPNKVHHVFVRRKANGAYKYKSVSDKNALPVEAYMKKCPTDCEIELWLQRGLRFHHITRDDVKKSPFAKFLQEDLSDVFKSNDNAINENYVYYHEALGMWINDKIYKAIVKYMDGFFPCNNDKNIFIHDKRYIYDNELNHCHGIKKEFHSKHCFACLDNLSFEELKNNNVRIDHCHHNTTFLLIGIKIMTDVQQILHERGEIDLSVLSKPGLPLAPVLAPARPVSEYVISEEEKAKQIEEAEKFRQDELVRVKAQREKKKLAELAQIKNEAKGKGKKK